jgi:hypothetical protein
MCRADSRGPRLAGPMAHEALFAIEWSRALGPGRKRRVYDEKRTFLSDDLVNKVFCVSSAWTPDEIQHEVCVGCGAGCANYSDTGRCWNCCQRLKVEQFQFLVEKYSHSVRVTKCSRCEREHVSVQVETGCPYTDCLYEVHPWLEQSLRDWGVLTRLSASDVNSR